MARRSNSRNLNLCGEAANQHDLFVSVTSTMVAVYGGDNQATYHNGAQSNTVSLTVDKREAGDVNGDGIVNCADLNLVKASLGQRRGEAGYNPQADINGDGVISEEDLTIVVSRFPGGTLARCDR